MSGRDAPDLSRPVSIDAIPPSGYPVAFTASTTERRRLAERFGLLALDRFEVTGRLIRDSADGPVRLQGRLQAEFVQSCVVTLAPVPGTLDVAFRRIYDPTLSDEWGQERDEIVLAAEADVDREPLTGSVVDPAEAACEEFGLELPPFPRAQGAVFTGFPSGEPQGADDRPAAGPFARLGDLARKRTEER